MTVKRRDRMFRSSSSCPELFWQSQSDTSSVHQLRKPKATIAVVASLILLLMVFVSTSVALHRRRGGPDRMREPAPSERPAACRQLQHRPHGRTRRG
ncbi:hypothetical protein MRX96_011330 [Rhipicephalus microplus]